MKKTVVSEETLLDTELDQNTPETGENADAADDARQPAEACYKSQSEIDAAFGKRLARERAKWERANAQTLELSRLAAQYLGGGDVQQALALLQEGTLSPLEIPPASAQHDADARAKNHRHPRMNDAHGADADACRCSGIFASLESPTGRAQLQCAGFSEAAMGLQTEESDEASTVGAENTRTMELVPRNAAAQPPDMIEALNQSPAMQEMLLNGVTLQQAYYALNPEQYKQTVEQEIIRNIRARQDRPVPLRGSLPRQTVPNIAALSDDEIRRIDERVKRGERVQF